MPRNHPRVNQTSTIMLQSWRGNCDLQILIYESSPDNFDLREVSKVTDYVVAYSCKGNSTIREEVETNKQLIMSIQETTGDNSELKRVCKQVMNKAAVSRLISKAEASLLLCDLSLTTCSEFIESVSVSNSLNLTVGTTRRTGILAAYAARPQDQENLSLHEFYPIYRNRILGKKPSIPHYVGINGSPTFPVTNSYARQVLIVYRPWRQYPINLQWKAEFDLFIRSRRCPESARLAYDRVVQRYYDGTKFVEPTSKDIDHSGNPISPSDEEVLLLAGLSGHDGNALTSHEMAGLHKGIDFDWGRSPQVCLKYATYCLSTTINIKQIFCRF
jgi:hypothetical protein